MPDPRPPFDTEPPQPADYTLSLSYIVSPNHFYTGGETAPASHLTCTLCDTKLATHFELPPYGSTNEEIHRWVTRLILRHQREKHPEKLWVQTNAGWVQAGHLFSNMILPVHD